MKHDTDMRGGFPVATYDGLSGTEQALVAVLRRWPDEARNAGDGIGPVLRAWMAPAAAMRCRQALEAVLGILARHGRRKLVRHRPNCSCVGADEAVFAHFVMTAATGEREDAMLIGSLMVEGALLLPLVDAARTAGLVLCRADLTGRRDGSGHAGATVH